MGRRNNRQSTGNAERSHANEETPRTRSSTGEERDVSPERVAMRAYERYVVRGREDGHDLDDWLEAERELREQDERPVAD